MPLTRRSHFKKVLSLLACVSALALGQPAAAQASNSKIAGDLLALIDAARAPELTWAKQINGTTYTKVLVVASSSDTKLAALRQDILARGGSVHYVYMSVRALSAMVPVSALKPLAARADVLTLSPNRVAARSASLVQDASGASAVARLANGTALDGSGVGIAVLDSGIDWNHRNFATGKKESRVKAVVDFAAFSGAVNQIGWEAGIDLGAAADLYFGLDKNNPAGKELTRLRPSIGLPDPFGHGTHVASVAAGAGGYQSPDSTGVAPGATLFDVRVLNANGVGNMADVLAGIDWVVQRSRLLNIRVMNLSLAANSTDSFLVDPLARAARSAVAAGIVVVAAAGNAGKNAAGQEIYGAIGSPGNEPSVITVGAANPRGTAARSDDLITSFSSRGPTRGGVTLANGSRWVDNLLKPDLVAPGNRIIGAVANLHDNPAPTGNLLASQYPALMRDAGAAQIRDGELMQLSGTSVAAPAVAGAAAVLLQANPGLTPPLVKAILQYTAQPLAGANLLQQGAGQMNLEGAVRLAQSLRSDIGSALANGTLRADDPLLLPGKLMPVQSSTLGGQAVNWGRIVTAGGGHLVSGDALFTRFQPIYDPALTWVRQVALRSAVQYMPAVSAIPANTVPVAIVESNAASQALLTPQVRLLDSLAGANSASLASGLFSPSSRLASGAAAGGGRLLGSGFILSEGFILAEGLSLAQQRLVGSGLILSEGFILAEGLILSEGLTLGSGFILAEGLILSEGFILGEGLILSETQADRAAVANGSLLGE